MFSRPIAHRGLHDAKCGVVENSRGAARAAIGKGYAIECDVQLSADGEAVVFHDDLLDRLTFAEGRLDAKPAHALTRLPLRGSTETIPTFAQLLETVAGRVPLVVELKSRFDGDPALARRVAALAAGYAGPLVIESFDPDPVALLRREGEALGVSRIPRGLVAQAAYDAAEWPELSDAQRRKLACWLHFQRALPEFVSFKAEDLPHAVPTLLRDALSMPVTAWTVRGAEQAAAVAPWVDQIVFEGFSP